MKIECLEHGMSIFRYEIVSINGEFGLIDLRDKESEYSKVLQERYNTVLQIKAALINKYKVNTKINPVVLVKNNGRRTEL